jgi:hypothetical protein
MCDTLERLLKSAVILVSDKDSPCGSLPTNISTTHEANEYLENPDSFFARKWGVSVQEYVLWKSSEGHVFCCANTSKNKPCRRIATEGHAIATPVEHAKLSKCGLLCSSHG